MKRIRTGKDSLSIIVNKNLLKKVLKAVQNSTESNLEGIIDSVFEELGIVLNYSEEDLNKIPANKPFITVSNLPFLGLDYLILLKILLLKRVDFRILAKNLFSSIEQFNPYIIDEEDWIAALNKAKEQLDRNGALGLFPVGNDLNTDIGKNNVLDLQWRTATLKFIKSAKVSVLPIFICTSRSRINVVFSKIHPILGNRVFRRNVVNKKPISLNVKIGTAITAKEQSDFDDIEQFGRFLRLKTYHLGSGLDIRQFFKFQRRIKLKSVEEIIPAVDENLIVDEINKSREQYFLFTNNNFSVFCIPSDEIPNTLREIGRLREITFREIGEGTNRSLDIDEYDLYYEHLVIWDEENSQLVGAYRVGKGDDIINQYGIEGFYIQSLFRIKSKFSPILRESLELGRSFIVKEYQKKPLSLFLLWKGILYFLVKNPEYRYLIGPVSISGDFSNLSKSLIVEFTKENYFHKDFSRFIKPKRRFRAPSKFLKTFDKEAFMESTKGDFKKLDKYLKELDSKQSTPVLLKKYAALGAQVLGFNTDPDFNYCLDSLIILDLFDVPIEIIEALSKEIEDESILSRFNFPGLYN